MNDDTVVLQVRDLKKHFPIHKGIFRKTVAHIKAVDGVSFSLRAKETLGVVGESGCGKTTMGRCVIRLIEPTSGSVLFSDGKQEKNILTASKKDLRDIREKMQIIFQDPFSSLNPRLNIERIVKEPLVLNHRGKDAEQKQRVEFLLEKVGINPAYMEKYPHEFSGGQRQRIGIARALILDPQIVICDEPVSALDVSIQAQVLNLLKSLQTELGLSYIFITHDLSVLYYMCDRIIVMYLGRIVEEAPCRDLYAHPLHPYSEALIKSIPMADPRNRKRRYALQGDVPDPSKPPPGCVFSSRCAYCLPLCKEMEPPLTAGGEGRAVACHRSRELNLLGFLDKGEKRQWLGALSQKIWKGMPV